MHKSAATYVLIAMMSLGGPAFAQDKGSQSQKPTTDQLQTTGQAPREIEAPIGHKQPRATEVPSEENLAPTREERALDRKLNICRNCRPASWFTKSNTFSRIPRTGTLFSGTNQYCFRRAPRKITLAVDRRHHLGERP
jgi:hypothetical protein